MFFFGPKWSLVHEEDEAGFFGAIVLLIRRNVLLNNDKKAKAERINRICLG